MDEGLPVRNRGPLGAKDDEGETKRRETHAFCWNKSWPRSVSAESLRILRFRVSVETAVAASATQRTDARGAGRREAASERPTGTRDDNDISQATCPKEWCPRNERSRFPRSVLSQKLLGSLGALRANLFVFSSPDLASRAPPKPPRPQGAAGLPAQLCASGASYRRAVVTVHAQRLGRVFPHEEANENDPVVPRLPSRIGITSRSRPSCRAGTKRGSPSPTGSRRS